MPAIVIEDQLEVPAGIATLSDFRRWTYDAAFPERGRIDWIAGRIEVDMAPESLYSHGNVKVEVARCLANIVKQRDLGELFTDRTRVAHPLADLGCEPDVVFLSHATLASDRIRLTEKSGRPGDYIEIEGPPDLVVEIVSDSSVAKDRQRLPPAYFAAGVSEFWLIDARCDPLLFQIHHRGAEGFQLAVADDDGFEPSRVFATGFRLDRHRNRHDHWTYDLLTPS